MTPGLVKSARQDDALESINIFTIGADINTNNMNNINLNNKNYLSISRKKPRN
jgi:hypothetical protein